MKNKKFNYNSLSKEGKVINLYKNNSKKRKLIIYIRKTLIEKYNIKLTTIQIKDIINNYRYKNADKESEAKSIAYDPKKRNEENNYMEKLRQETEDIIVGKEPKKCISCGVDLPDYWDYEICSKCGGMM